MIINGYYIAQINIDAYGPEGLGGTRLLVNQSVTHVTELDPPSLFSVLSVFSVVKILHNPLQSNAEQSNKPQKSQRERSQEASIS